MGDILLFCTFWFQCSFFPEVWEKKIYRLRGSTVPNVLLHLPRLLTTNDVTSLASITSVVNSSSSSYPQREKSKKFNIQFKLFFQKCIRMNKLCLRRKRTITLTEFTQLVKLLLNRLVELILRKKTTSPSKFYVTDDEGKEYFKIENFKQFRNRKFQRTEGRRSSRHVTRILSRMESCG